MSTKVNEVHILFHGSDNFTPTDTLTLADGRSINLAEYFDNSNIKLIRQPNIAYTDSRRAQDGLIHKFTDIDDTNTPIYREVITNTAAALAEQVKKDDNKRLVVCDGPTCMGAGIDAPLAALLEYLDSEDIDWLNSPTFKLTGFSRGAVNCRVATHLINDLYKRKLIEAGLSEEQAIAHIAINTIDIVTVDPVPGPTLLMPNGASTYWQPNRLNSLPDNVHETTLFAKNERSLGLYGLLPENADSLYNKGQLVVETLPGHHMTVAGCIGYFDNCFSNWVNQTAKQGARQIANYVLQKALSHHGLQAQPAKLDLTEEQVKAVEGISYRPWASDPRRQRQIRQGFSPYAIATNDQNIGKYHFTKEDYELDMACIAEFDSLQPQTFNQKLEEALNRLSTIAQLNPSLQQSVDKLVNAIKQCPVSELNEEQCHQLKLIVIKTKRLLNDELPGDAYINQISRLNEENSIKQKVIGRCMLAVSTLACISGIGLMFCAPLAISAPVIGLGLLGYASYLLAQRLFSRNKPNDIQKCMNNISKQTAESLEAVQGAVTTQQESKQQEASALTMFSLFSSEQDAGSNDPAYSPSFSS